MDTPGPTASPASREAPSIDVLLPVRSARRTLPWALADVLAQQDVTLRVLAIVDDEPGGGDDGSRAWLQDAAALEPRLTLLDGPGQGAAAALQHGLDAVRAPLLSHMEADDRCPPGRLARLAAALREDPALQAVTSRAGQIGARTAGMRRYLDWQNSLLSARQMAAERFVEIPALHQTGLYRTAALRAVGGYRTRGPWPVDIDFWLRWFEHGLPVAKVPAVLYRWRQHAGQATRDDGSHGLAVLRAAKIDALRRLHGPAGRCPRPLRLVSTGATLLTWERELRQAGLALADVRRWRPGEPAPPRPDDGSLLLAVYGMAPARDALREALGRPHEPEELLFAA